MLVLGLTCVTGCAASPAKDALAAPVADCAKAPADGLAQLTDEQLARKMLDVTGASKLGEQVADSMLETFRKMPNLPAGFIDKLRQNMHGSDLIELIVPIYLKHYDRATMITVIRFYQSEPGKALISSLPAVTAESMEAGKAWGKVLAEKTLHDLGYDAKKP